MGDISLYTEIINEGLNPQLFAWIKGFCCKDLFSCNIGVRITKLVPGKAYVELVTENYHANLAGSLHGGVTATLADLSMGIACFTTGFVAAATNMNMSYLAAGEIGQKITAVGHVVRAGKKVIFTETIIENEYNLIIAKASGLYTVVSPIPVNPI
jgi:acyl-CoA thioesterase